MYWAMNLGTVGLSCWANHMLRCTEESGKAPSGTFTSSAPLFGCGEFTLVIAFPQRVEDLGCASPARETDQPTPVSHAVLIVLYAWARCASIRDVRFGIAIDRRRSDRSSRVRPALPCLCPRLSGSVRPHARVARGRRTGTPPHGPPHLRQRLSPRPRQHIEPGKPGRPWRRLPPR